MEKMSEKIQPIDARDVTSIIQANRRWSEACSKLEKEADKLCVENAQLKKELEKSEGIAENYRLLGVGLAEKCANENIRALLEKK